MDEGAVGPLPLPQDHVQLGVVRVGVEGAQLVHVQGLGVDLGREEWLEYLSPSLGLPFSNVCLGFTCIKIRCVGI